MEFDDEIKELLLGSKLSGKIRDPVFYRLIDSVLHWDYDKNIHDFRIVLLNLTQWCIYHKVREVSYPVYGKTITDLIVQPDLLRAWAWAKALAERKDVDQWVEPEDHHRPVLF